MTKRAKMRFPKPLAEIIPESLKGHGLAERLREADIWRLWPDVVGAVIAFRAEPVRIINGTLTVAVSSGPWMQELTFLKGMLKEKLNSRLGAEIVKEIILKSGKVTKGAAVVVDEPPPKRVLTLDQVALIAEQSATIPDKDIREAFAALMTASFESGHTARRQS